MRPLRGTGAPCADHNVDGTEAIVTPVSAVFSMSRRDTLVIKIFQSVPEKSARGEFIPLGRHQFDGRLLLRPEKIESAPQLFPWHSSFHKIALRQFPKKLYLVSLPLQIAAQLFRQDLRHAGSHLNGGPGVEEERAGAPRENVFHGARHLLAHSPNHFRCAVRQGRVHWFAETRIAADNLLNERRVGAVKSQRAE